MRPLLATVVGIALLVLPTMAHAQAPPGEDVAKGAIQFALDNMAKLTCMDRPCTPATAEEHANPPVTPKLADSVLQRGFLSGIAEVCGLDWQKRNFLPLMSYWRSKGQTVRQMAMIGAIHGLGMGLAERQVTVQLCSSNKPILDKQLDFKPDHPE